MLVILLDFSGAAGVIPHTHVVQSTVKTILYVEIAVGSVQILTKQQSAIARTPVNGNTGKKSRFGFDQLPINKDGNIAVGVIPC